MNKRFLEWECEKKIAKKYFKGSCEDKGAEDKGGNCQQKGN
jgi:hypothetical protein